MGTLVAIFRNIDTLFNAKDLFVRFYEFLGMIILFFVPIESLSTSDRNKFLIKIVCLNLYFSIQRETIKGRSEAWKNSKQMCDLKDVKK